MKILFVTRKFPPVIGGMENVAARLYEELSAKETVELVAVRSKTGGKHLGLPFAYLNLAWRSLRTGKRLNPDIIYIQDGVLAPLGRFLHRCLKRPVVVTVHGTEVVYGNRIYRKFILPSLAKMHHTVAISTGTAEKTKKVFPLLPITIINWGSDDSYYIEQSKSELRKKLAADLNIDLSKRPLLYHSGRLVERKGALWLVEKVMPRVAEVVPDVLLLISGGGKDAEKIRLAIIQNNLQENVRMVGYVLGERRRLLYNASDLFIMPNVPGYGFEGFGMVAVESSSCGTPVVASRFEGIIDAVVEGRTGWLLEPGNADDFVERIVAEIKAPSLKRQDVRLATLKKYDWEKTTANYLKLFDTVITRK